jgi:hypothetical protein
MKVDSGADYLVSHKVAKEVFDENGEFDMMKI